ncbi:MAG: hypothetical protein QXE76_06840 [Candidatus Bathyarchaeia archaeon]
MPWETTSEYIRSGHRNPNEFEPTSFRTIWISEKEGIKAVVGKPKGKDTMEIVSYLFLLEKGWTLEKAKEWFGKHNPNSERFCCLMPIMEKIVDKPLRISGVAITAGISRNFNIYLEEELIQFAPKLVGAPVYLEHVSASNAVGKVTNAHWDQKMKAVWYEAEIYDEETAEKIRKGLIQHVSIAADYNRINILDGKIPHGLHNAELSLVAVPGFPQTNIQIMEKLNRNPANARRVHERIWIRQYISNLPDSAFAVVYTENGKTIRKFPHHNASGEVDLPHLRNANARLPQSEIPEEQKRKAMLHLALHKKQFGIGMQPEEAKLLEQQETTLLNQDNFEVAPEPSIDELIASIENTLEELTTGLETLTKRVTALEKQARIQEAKKTTAQGVVAPEALEANQTPVDLSKMRLRDIMKQLS